MFLQIPVFLGLFHTLRRLNPHNQLTTLYGWTAQQFSDATHATLFTAPLASKFGSTPQEVQELGAHSATVKVVAGILVLLMMATTYATSRQMILKTGWAEDPQQKMIQRLMLYGIPLSLLVSGSLFPIGVVIYWVTNNAFTLGQQQWVLRKFPPPQMAKKATAGSKAAPVKTGPPAKKNGNKATGPVQPSRTSGGLFGRKPAEPEPQSPVVDVNSRAPKPGAKPMNNKKGARPANKPRS
jgi:YidC/Oxa1 family membrane protein insertase